MASLGIFGSLVGAEALGRGLDAVSRTIPSEAKGPQQELWQLIGAAEVHQLQHMETVMPRHEDLDIAHNVAQASNLDSAYTLTPNNVATIANGASLVLRFIARRGWVAHVSGLKVTNLNPAGSMASVTVTAAFEGRIIQRVPELSYARPVMLDRDDVLLITIANASGADVSVAYAINGWLRANKAC